MCNVFGLELLGIDFVWFVEGMGCYVVWVMKVVEFGEVLKCGMMFKGMSFVEVVVDLVVLVLYG